jgi:hypothetical protein
LGDQKVNKIKLSLRLALCSYAIGLGIRFIVEFMHNNTIYNINPFDVWFDWFGLVILGLLNVSFIIKDVTIYLNKTKINNMNKLLLFASMPVFFLLFSSSVSAYNFLQNGNFETGNFNYWNVFPLTDVRVSPNCMFGNYCANLTGWVHDTNIAQQPISAITNAVYVNFSWKTTGGASLIVGYVEPLTYFVLTGSSGVANESFFVTDTITNLVFYCHHATYGGSCLIDDVSISNGTELNYCFDITTSGNYSLTENILADKEPCININASNVVLDLNGFTITDYVNSHSGILVQTSNVSEPLNNITIKNGRLDWFDNTGLYVAYVNNVTVDNLQLTRSHSGVEFHYVSNASLTNSVLTENAYGLTIAGYPCSNYWVENNQFISTLTDIRADCLFNSVILSNKLGNATVDPSCCTNQSVYVNLLFGIGKNIQTQTCILPCGSVYSGSTNGGLTCSWCNYTDFVNNYIYSQKDSSFSYSGSNRFIFNTFSRRLDSDVNGLFLDTSTNDNFGCGNQGYVYDSGFNNSFIADCPSNIGYNITPTGCISNWKCLDSKTIAYQMPDCSFTNQITCSSGKNCLNGTCAVLTPSPEIPSDVSGSLLPIGSTIPQLKFIDKLFTPFFLLTMMMLGVSGWISHTTSKQGENLNPTVFGVTVIVFSLIFTVIGVYPAWIGIVMIIIVALYLARTLGVIPNR